MIIRSKNVVMQVDEMKYNLFIFWEQGYPIVNDPLYNHPVFGPEKGKGGLIGKTDEQLIQELISIHNAENWLGIEGEDGGGGGGDIFGSSATAASTVVGGGGTVITNDANCHHLNTASGPSSCTSVQSDNGSSVGSTMGDGFSVVLDNCNNNSLGCPVSTMSGNSELDTVKSEETQVALPVVLGVVNKKQDGVGMVNGGKVTVGTQTNDEGTQTECTTEGVSADAALVTTPPALSNSMAQQTQANAGSDSAIKCDDDNMGNSSSQGVSTIASGVGDDSPVGLAVRLCGPPGFRNELMTYDPHCYECKVRYRDPKPKDLVMYLHALTYKVSVCYMIY